MEHGPHYSFETFENTLIDIDQYLAPSGYLTIYNSTYLLEETILTSSYDINNILDAESGYVTKYHKDGQRLDDTHKFIFYKKKP